MENTFIPYSNALDILEANLSEFPTEKLPIFECNGRVLAEDLKADRNFPPYDRVTMDGIAIQFDSYRGGNRSFIIESTSPAGTPEARLQNASNCIEVMTGSMLPQNTDTVIRYEDFVIDNGVAKLDEVAFQKQQNIHFKGMDIPEGKTIVSRGCQISSAEINIAASVGKNELEVVKMPSAVIISTGDELVDIHEKPMAHQIRRSNVYGIRNTLKEWGVNSGLNHLPDDKPKMKAIIMDLLEDYDMLIFTGGVSKGKFDYLPEVLEELNVKRHFHKIQQRPGKPFWFGTATNGKPIFALPGNPVSSFVCLYAYIKFWLQKSLNIPVEQLKVELLNDVSFKPDLVYFPEARLSVKPDGKLGAEVVLGNGSGDFVNLVKTDGFMILPQDKTEFKKGEIYPFIQYRKKMW
ncbi:MAG: molybdopterin molybdotransferase MoeA [Eudoraea sp.]|nr:molybdopterin molybdotransferase MoeA [Eudoraea sp.]